jgi:hypothetical protein
VSCGVFVAGSVFCVFLGVFLFLLVFFLLCTVTAQWIMYRSHPALLFDAHCRPDNVATALIRRICKVQLAFRLDKRPGESHMALDGKKSFAAHTSGTCAVCSANLC